jgi:hypothetical protein
MLRPIPFLLGLLLLFAVVPTTSHASSKRATSNRAKATHAAKANAARANAAKTNAARANAARANAKKKPTEPKLKPAQPPAESPAPAPAAVANGSPAPSRGPTRIDFDDRLIQGQTNKSGAVYLYDRKELKTPSMIKKRESFREEIVATIYGN